MLSGQNTSVVHNHPCASHLKLIPPSQTLAIGFGIEALCWVLYVRVCLCLCREVENEGGGDRRGFSLGKKGTGGSLMITNEVAAMVEGVGQAAQGLGQNFF